MKMLNRLLLPTKQQGDALMPTILGPTSAVGTAANSQLFGGNILADRGNLTGPGSYQEVTQDLGVTDLRYPGGSLTEYTFDISNPNATTVIDERTGEEKSYIPISDFLNYAGSAGHSATIVLPTRKEIGEAKDANGNRYEDVDQDVLREFVHDVMTGVHGDADITAFEIGNEYWGSGEMTATEYGRVASKMAKVVNDELNLISEVYGVDTSGVDVVFQMGHNYNFSRLSEEYEGWSSEDVIADLQQRYPDADIDDRFAGQNDYVNFSGINNELVQAEFNEEEIEAVDGIVAHVYSRGESNTGSRTWDLRLIEKGWLDDEGFEDLKVYVTEWNQKSVSSLDADTDYGLYQAHEMLNVVEEFMTYGVDVAHVWPLIQNTKNPLSSGMEYEELGVPGEMFAMMAEQLPGKMMVDFQANSSQTEAADGNVDVHGFAGDGDLVLYLASNSRYSSEYPDVDISRLVADFDQIDTKLLGVAEGELPGGSRADASVEEISQEDVYEDGTLQAELKPGEIMQIVIKGVVPTEEFAETFAIANGDTPPVVDPDDPDEPDNPDTPDEPDNPDTPDEPEGPVIPDRPADPEEPDEDSDDDSSFDMLGDIGWAALFIMPLLGAFALG